MHFVPRMSVGGLILVMWLCSLESVAGQEGAAPDLQLGDAYKLSDQQAQRLRSNVPYFGVPITGRVAQRFEMYSPHSEQDLRELKSMGFTQVILDWPNLHDAATKAGLKVVLANWWIDKTKPKEIELGIERARKVDPKSLIGFSVMDEPGRNSPDTPFEYYIDLYEELQPKFREEFPDTRLEISHWGPMASWEAKDYESFSSLYAAADVMRIMPYPDLHEAPLDDVFLMVHRSRKLTQIAKRELPLVIILQTWILPPDNRLPEVNELRVMAYQALFSGAETISFFDYNTEVWEKTAGFEDGFRALMSELTTFSNRHRDDIMTSAIGEDGVLSVMLVSPTGVRTSVIVNTRRQAVRTLLPLEVQIRTLDDVGAAGELPSFTSTQGSRCRAIAASTAFDNPVCGSRSASDFARPICLPRSCSPKRRTLRRTRR